MAIRWRCLLLRKLLWAAALSISLVALPLSAHAQDRTTAGPPATAMTSPQSPADEPAVPDEFTPQSSFTTDQSFFAANNTPFASDNEAGGT